MLGYTDAGSFTHQGRPMIHCTEVLTLESSSGATARMVWEPDFQILDHVSFADRRFNLREPVQITVSLDSGLWAYRADALGIESFGGSKDAAEASFCEDFAVIYDEIAQESDDRLTPEAIRLKRSLLYAVESVTTTQ